MRRWLRIVGFATLSLLSLPTIIFVMDWYGRIDWLKGFMLVHPEFSAFIRTPWCYIILAVLGVIPLYVDKWIKEPHLIARYVNSRWAVDLHTAKFGAITAAEHKTPGWDTHKFDWDWFAQIHVVNDSDFPTTIDGIEFEVRLKPAWWKRRKLIRTQYLEDLGDFDVDMSRDQTGKPHGRKVVGTAHRLLESFMGGIRGEALEREIGHQGWLHLKVFDVSQHEFDQVRADIFLIDAMQRRHRLVFKKGDEKKWDLGFYIFPKL